MIAVTTPFPQYFDKSGQPLNAGSLFFGVMGQDPTSNPITVFWDRDGTIPAAQPIKTVNGVPARAGSPAVLYVADAAYSLQCMNKKGELIFYAPNGADYSNTGLLLAQINTLSDLVHSNITVVAGTGVTDNTAAVQAANDLGRPILFTGVSVLGSHVTIGAPIIDTLGQIFDPNSQVTIANQFVRPDWFGAAAGLDLAVNALPVTGGKVKLADKTYPAGNFHYGFAGDGKFIGKDNVTIEGEKMPTLTDDCTSLMGGSIVQGMTLVYANNFEARDVGFDVGKAFVDAHLGGSPAAGYADGLLLTYPNDAAKTAPQLRKTAKLHNVIGLSYGPDSPTHGIIAGEGYDAVNCTGEVIGMFGTHAIAVKCQSFTAERLSAYCNNTNGLVVKSDTPTTARAIDVQIDTLFCRDKGPVGWSPYALPTSGVGLRIYSAGQDISRVQIGKAMLYGYPSCLKVQFDSNNTIDDITIGELITDQAGAVGVPAAGVNLDAAAGVGNIARFHLGIVSIRNTMIGVYASFGNSGLLANQLTIGTLEVVNASDVGVNVALQAYVNIGQYIASNCGAGAYRITGTPALTVLSMRKVNGTTIDYSNTLGGLAPALTNGWTNVVNGDPFGVDLLGGTVRLRGLVMPGSSNVLTTLPQWAWPLSPRRYIAQANNAGAVTAVPVTVSVAGVVTVNEIAGGTTNCTTWLSLDGISYDTQA